MKSKENLFGAWAILTGVILALVLGIFQANFAGARQDWLYLLLVFLGIIIGFISIKSDSNESTTFLFAAVSLVIVSSLGQQTLSIGNIGIKIGVVLDTLLIMFIPATIIVALKTVFSLTKV